MASLPELPNVGDIVAERFELRRVLGEGGMGIVFESFDRRAKRLCALKILFPHFCDQPQIVARFDREARIASKLRGPHVARVFEVAALPNGLRTIAMELLVGRDLRSEIDERGPLPVATAVDVVIQAAEAMDEAHAIGVVHRDLKPENLFLVGSDLDRGSSPIVKVLDFGISRLLHGKENLTTDFAQLGTAHYMSPEQIEAASRVDRRTDVWSLGVVLYEMLVGRPPFQGEGTGVIVAIATRPVRPPSTLRDDLPPGLEAVVMRALEKSPDARFQNMTELARALAPWAPAGRRYGRSRTRVLLFGAAAAAAAIGIGVAALGLDVRSAPKLAEAIASAPSPSAADPPGGALSAAVASSTAAPTRRPAPARGTQKSRAGAHPAAVPAGKRRP